MTSALSGRHALVTGASRGIGGETAMTLARMGINVTLVARGATGLKEAASRLRENAGARVHCYAADVTDADAVDAAFDSAEAALGPVEILINNAGGVESAPFVKTDLSLFVRMIELNLNSVYLCCARALPSMIERGFGRIVNVASTAGLNGYPFVSAYVAAKHGVIGLTRSLSTEVGPNITVNAVCPAYVDTDMLRESARRVASVSGRDTEGVLDVFRKANASGRLITPGEVADVVVSLCLDDSRRGEAVVIDGGSEE